MAVKISSTVRIAVPVGDEQVVFICRRPSAQELSKFLNSRFSAKRNKMESRLYPARSEFFDAIAIDAENVTFENADGLDVPLCAATSFTEADINKWRSIMGKTILSWRDLIAENWKSAVAMRFEDSGTEVEEPEEDSKN